MAVPLGNGARGGAFSSPKDAKCRRGEMWVDIVGAGLQSGAA
jgi:hypothetical protein